MGRLALILVLVTAVGCVRPIHRRTFVFHIAGQTGFDHPATLDENALGLALAGRIAPADLPGMAHAMARAFRRMHGGEVIYYRRPEGGAYLFAVQGGALVVTPYGRAGKADRYALADLSRAASTRGGRPKVIVRGAVEAADAPGAIVQIESAFAIEQFVYVNGTFQGTVAPGQSRAFDVAPGHVTLLVADAADGVTNAVTLELDVAAGKQYALSVEPEI